MNPLDALRAPLGYTDPLTRAARHGAAAEAAEFRQMELDRQAAAERSAALAEMQYAAERAEIARDGYSQREAAEAKRARDDARAERIAELEAELERLDPARRAQARRAQAGIDAAALLARARAAGEDPFMRRMCAEFDAREEIRRAGRMQDKIRRLEAGGYRPPDERGRPMISR